MLNILTLKQQTIWLGVCRIQNSPENGSDHVVLICLRQANQCPSLPSMSVGMVRAHLVIAELTKLSEHGDGCRPLLCLVQHHCDCLHGTWSPYQDIRIFYRLLTNSNKYHTIIQASITVFYIWAESGIFWLFVW